MRVTWPVAFMTACVTIGIVDSACGETRAWSQSSNTIQYLADKPGSHFCAMFHAGGRRLHNLGLIMEQFL